MEWTMIKVTLIETGRASLKSVQRTARAGASAFQRKIDIVRDTSWVESLPIFAVLVEHPEGRFLIDTGDTWRNSAPGYLPRWNPFFTKMVHIKVAPHEEIGPRLQAMNLDPIGDIAAVILTHWHHDHTGGLDHFTRNRIIGARENFLLSRRFAGKVAGCLPQRWPIWLKPELVDMDGPPLGPFPTSQPITKDGRIALVPTPGHMKGHVSVVVRGEGVTYFLAGDASYNEENLRANDPDVALATLRAIKRFAAEEPTIYLPAHDPEGPARLAERRVFV
jgi:glyoxylase-like metal-dependent hydrolase (beta-lactamase superfamily II)